MNCPNCKTEIEDEVTICPECGNPLFDGKPWDKKTKEQKNIENKEIADAIEKHGIQRDESPKMKVTKEFNNPLFNLKIKSKEKINPETYLDHDFVVSKGYCSYTHDLENPAEMVSGTIVLTKEAMIFGKSEYDIGCGRFDIEIPLEIVDYYTDARVDNKDCYKVHTINCDVFYFYVWNKKEWRTFMDFVLTYRESPEIEEVSSGKSTISLNNVSSPKESDTKTRWVPAAACVVLAFFVFASSYVLDLDGTIKSIVTFIACALFVLSGFFIFRKD